MSTSPYHYWETVHNKALGDLAASEDKVAYIKAKLPETIARMRETDYCFFCDTHFSDGHEADCLLVVLGLAEWRNNWGEPEGESNVL